MKTITIKNYKRELNIDLENNTDLYEIQEILDKNTVTRKFSENFIEYAINFLDMYLVCQYQKLSLKFIRKHQNIVHWLAVTMKQNLNARFIEEFSDKIYWEYVPRNQNVSDKFLEKHSLKFANL